MNHPKIINWVLMALILAIIPVHRAVAQSSSKSVIAYYEWSGSYDSLAQYSSSMNGIATDVFGVDVQGNISGAPPKGGFKLAKSKGMQTFAVISNFGKTDFSPHIAHVILTMPAVRNRTISSMLRVVEESGYSGINIDFEAVPSKDRTAFSTFVRDISIRMRKAGYLTMVSVPAAESNDPHDSWTGAFDYAAIGKSADIFQLMTYDENGPWGPTGPVAGLDWVEACVKFAVSVMPSNKVSLGVPAYGYDWNTSNGTGTQVHWANIPALISRTGATPQWDTTTSSPFFSYQTSNGANHVVWYEDSASIPLKSALVVSYNLGGVSVFALGFEDQSFWDALHAGGF